MFNWLKKALPVSEKVIHTTAAAEPCNESLMQHDMLNESASYKKRGNEFLAQGQLEEAVECYRKAVAINPDYAEGFLNLGFVLKEQKLFEEAESLLKQAILINPEMADAYYLLGTASQEQGNLPGAIENFTKALEFKPDFEIAYRDLSLALFQSGQQARAEMILLKAIALYPTNAEFHYYLGKLYAHEESPDQAIDYFLKALSIQPEFAEAHNDMGLVLQAQDKLEAAVQSYQRAFSFKSDYAEAHANLGAVLHKQGKLEAAIESYRKALVIAPDFAIVHNNLASVLQTQGRLREAIECYRHAIFLNPDIAEAHNNLGCALEGQGELDEAVQSYRCAISLRPGYAEAYNNLGYVFYTQGKLDEAIESYRHALSMKPDYIQVYSNLLFIRSFHSNLSPAQYLAEARNYGSKVMAQAKPYSHWPVYPAENGSQPLRVGLISGDFKNHPVGFFLESVLAHLDPAQVELVAYPSEMQEDEFTARIKPRFAAWEPIAGLSDEYAARKIHEDGIHILIDLAGHTAHNRLPVFAWKPAPVQVSWLGYFASTGVPGIDYLLADPVSVPESNREQFTETVWCLPDTRLCFTAPAANSDLLPASLPAIRNGYVTFGCFQRPDKMNDRVFELWGRIVQALPQSRLRLQNEGMNSPAAREQMLDRLARVGVGPECILIEGAVPRKDYLAAHADVDIILDTFPYPGGTTTCEALWMGVPTLTLAGDTMLSRQGAGLLTCAGLEEWIASDEEDYIVRALALAADVNRLAQLRSGLREKVLASPLFDAPRFARHLEAALQGMWQQKMLGVAEHA